jgi:hypothetical protein
MITLITGLPGNGKTLYALSWLKERAEKEGRTVYYSGIADCKIPGWVEGDPEKWMELPKGSIIVIDEVQRVMRPRQHGTKVPEFVAALETHRHLGVDLVLITQHPMLLDSNVRRLVGQHKHVVRKFGTSAATIHEWTSVKEGCDKNREGSIEHHWLYPKATFALYKSAELHTKHGKIPMKVWVLMVLPFILGALVYVAYQRLMNKPKGPIVNAFTGETAASGGAAGHGHMTKAAYLEQYVPRVKGLAYTAPVYDDVTKVVQAPYPAACVGSGGSTLNAAGLDAGSRSPERCQCYTQQGTRIEVTPAICRDIVAGGFFVPWQAPTSPAPPAVQQQPQVAAQEPPPFGGSWNIGRRGDEPSGPSGSILAQSDPSQLPPGQGRAPTSRQTPR